MDALHGPGDRNAAGAQKRDMLFPTGYLYCSVSNDDVFVLLSRCDVKITFSVGPQAPILSAKRKKNT